MQETLTEPYLVRQKVSSNAHTGEPARLTDTSDKVITVTAQTGVRPAKRSLKDGWYDQDSIANGLESLTRKTKQRHQEPVVLPSARALHVGLTLLCVWIWKNSSSDLTLWLTKGVQFVHGFQYPPMLRIR